MSKNQQEKTTFGVILPKTAEIEIIRYKMFTQKFFIEYLLHAMYCPNSQKFISEHKWSKISTAIELIFYYLSLETMNFLGAGTIFYSSLNPQHLVEFGTSEDLNKHVLE